VRLVLANPDLASVGQAVQELREPTGDWEKIIEREKSKQRGFPLLIRPTSARKTSGSDGGDAIRPEHRWFRVAKGLVDKH